MRILINSKGNRRRVCRWERAKVLNFKSNRDLHYASRLTPPAGFEWANIFRKREIIARSHTRRRLWELAGFMLLGTWLFTTSLRGAIYRKYSQMILAQSRWWRMSMNENNSLSKNSELASAQVSSRCRPWTKIEMRLHLNSMHTINRIVILPERAVPSAFISEMTQEARAVCFWRKFGTLPRLRKLCCFAFKVSSQFSESRHRKQTFLTSDINFTCFRV